MLPRLPVLGGWKSRPASSGEQGGDVGACGSEAPPGKRGTALFCSVGPVAALLSVGAGSRGVLVHTRAC